MENLSPTLFWAMLVAFWAILLAAVGVTAWLVGRLSGKVDWKIYQEHRDKMDEKLTDILELLARLDERTMLAEPKPPTPAERT